MKKFQMPNPKSQGLGFTPTRTLPHQGGRDAQVIYLDSSLSPGGRGLG
jgi:hypothetical protein